MKLSRKQRALRRQRLVKLGAFLCGGVLLLGVATFLLLRSNGPSNDAAAHLATSEPSSAIATAPLGPPVRSKVGALVEGAFTPPDSAPVPPPAEARANGGSRFSLPVAAFAAIDDWFGTPRQYGAIHGGVDFGLESMGSVAIRSACDGSVSEAGIDSTYGPHVIIDCGSGWTTLYAYLGSVDVSKGALADKTTELGTSDVDDAFLHFEIRWQGVPVDPANYLDLPPRPQLQATATPASNSGAAEQPRATSTRAVQPTTQRNPAATPTATSIPTDVESATAPVRTATRTPTATATPTPPPPTPTNTPQPTPTPRPSRATPADAALEAP